METMHLSRHWVRYQAYCKLPARKNHFIMCVMREKVTTYWQGVSLHVKLVNGKYTVGRIKLSTQSLPVGCSVHVDCCCICLNVFGLIDRTHFRVLLIHSLNLPVSPPYANICISGAELCNSIAMQLRNDCITCRLWVEHSTCQPVTIASACLDTWIRSNKMWETLTWPLAHRPKTKWQLNIWL
jgi:hypothetical protein